jgi:hypothetical protein
MAKLTRRQLLAGSAALSATAAAGGVSLLAIADVEEQLLAYFEKVLPDVRIDRASARQCVKDFLVWRQWSQTKQLVAGAAWSVTGIDTMAALNQNFEWAARRAVTLLITNSKFFYLEDPRSEPIIYESRPPGAACNNPFANLAPPDQGLLDNPPS